MFGQGYEVKGYTSFHSFCLVIDKQSRTISMTVDGQVTMEEVNQLAVTTGLQPGVNFKESRL